MHGKMADDCYPSGGEIFVIDDDPAVRDTLTLIFSVAGYRTVCFADGAALLSLARIRTPSCILIDLHILGESGLDILKELHRQDYPAPIFMISGHGNIAAAVSAIKNGAFDFIQKPFKGSDIVSRVEEAISAYRRRLQKAPVSPTHSLRASGRHALTRRERQVLDQFAAGASNKDAGRQLGISPRTIEDHRARIMKKLGVNNTVDLIRIAMATSR